MGIREGRARTGGEFFVIEKPLFKPLPEKPFETAQRATWIWSSAARQPDRQESQGPQSHPPARSPRLHRRPFPGSLTATPPRPGSADAAPGTVAFPLRWEIFPVSPARCSHDGNGEHMIRIMTISALMMFLLAVPGASRPPHAGKSR
jgi:hypothetical protein